MAIITAFSMMGVFFLVGLYVAGALGVLSLVMMEAFSDAPLWNILGNKAWESNTNFILVAVPLFLLMGELMLRSGMGERMYAALSRWLVFLPGGLLHTNIASCAVFAACSGSSVATSATISRVSLPSFRQRGYSERLVIGSLAAGGTLGILIPPSIGLIIFGVLVEESIGRLYMGGFLPGFLLAFTMIVMMVVTSIIFPRTAPMDEEIKRLYRAWFHGAGIRRYTAEQLETMRREQAAGVGIDDRTMLSYGEAVSEWLRILGRAVVGMAAIIPVLIIIVVVLGSIYTGWATPTEAAALGVFGALVVAIANELFKKMQGIYAEWSDSVRGIRYMLLDAIISTVRTSSMIMLIVMAAFTLSFAFARLGISQDISEWITGLNLNALQFVIILVFFYLLLGTFMESFAMLVTTIPILTPSLEAVGVDLVWFGIIMVILVEAALISPPEGINLYILHGVRQDVDQQMAEQTAAAQEVLRESTITDVYIGVLPFMGCMAVVIALLFAFPDIALWAPCIIYDTPGNHFALADIARSAGVAPEVLDEIGREAMLARDEQMRFRDLIDWTITQSGSPALAQLGTEGIQDQIRAGAGDASLWENVRYCSSEFRPRAYQ